MKNRRTVARVKHTKNYKRVHWLHIVKTFELSAVRLPLSADKNGKNDNYFIYKNRWGYKKNIFEREKSMYLSVKKLIVLFQKKRVLIREGPWIVVYIICRSGVPWFVCLAYTRRTLISHLGIFKVNRIIWRPSAFSDVGTSCLRFHIPHVFFFWFQSSCQFLLQNLLTTFGWRSIGGRDLEEGNSCCNVLNGLLTTRISRFWRSLARAFHFYPLKAVVWQPKARKF